MAARTGAAYGRGGARSAGYTTGTLLFPERLTSDRDATLRGFFNWHVGATRLLLFVFGGGLLAWNYALLPERPYNYLLLVRLGSVPGGDLPLRPVRASTRPPPSSRAGGLRCHHLAAPLPTQPRAGDLQRRTVPSPGLATDRGIGAYARPDHLLRHPGRVPRAGVFGADPRRGHRPLAHLVGAAAHAGAAHAHPRHRLRGGARPGPGGGAEPFWRHSSMWRIRATTSFTRSSATKPWGSSLSWRSDW